MNTTMLRITGMTCDQCTRTVEDALNRLPQVKVNVSYKCALAEVEALNDSPRHDWSRRCRPRATA